MYVSETRKIGNGKCLEKVNRINKRRHLTRNVQAFQIVTYLGCIQAIWFPVKFANSRYGRFSEIIQITRKYTNKSKNKSMLLTV